MLANVLPKRSFVFSLILALLLSGMALAALAVVHVRQAITAVEDPSRYVEIITAYDKIKSPLAKHFPREIPQNAQNVKLFYLPDFLQGANILELKMQLPPNEVQKIRDKAMNQAARRYVPGATDNSPLEESYGSFNVTFSYSLHIGAAPGPFPQDYAIYVLHDSRGAPEYDWNHPEMFGVAVNEANSDVVYWMQDW